MQILANALPGFRDLRAPLIAGYMWLLFAWLCATPNLDTMSTGIGGSLHDLSQRAGPIWTAVSAGVAAYLIGALSQAASTAIRELLLLFPPFAEISVNLSYDFRRGLREDASRAETMIQRAKQLAAHPDEVKFFEEMLRDKFGEATREAARELDLPATLLVGAQGSLFAEVDRLRAEGDLRMAVFPPLVALSILLACELSGWWLLLLPAAGILFYQGVMRYLDSKKLISDAKRLGQVNAASATKFRQWVDEDLSPAIERMRNQEG